MAMRSCTLPTRSTRAKVFLGVTQSMGRRAVSNCLGGVIIGRTPTIPINRAVILGRRDSTSSVGFSKPYSSISTAGRNPRWYDCYLENAIGNRRPLTTTTVTTTITKTSTAMTAQQKRDERERLQREQKRVLQLERLKLLEEAAFLTKSMYRICLRSVNLIRPGNEMDEKDFQKRHDEFRNPKPSGSGSGGSNGGRMSSMSNMSMSRPPNREDELESRAAYYYSFCRESFLQESDCLEEDPLKGKNIQRFVYFLKKADKDRKWLLADMMFPDPYKNALSHDRIQQFEEMARRHLGEPEPSLLETHNNNNNNNKTTVTTSSSSMKQAKEDTMDPFDDEVTEDPDWFQKKYPHLR